MYRLSIMLICLVVTALGQATPSAAHKLAFVVGMDRYQNLDPNHQLKKAVNDARAISAALGRLGFDTTLVENTGRLQLVRQWQKFLNRIEAGDITAFYFSGHGVQIDGVNYLLPSNVSKVTNVEQELLKETSLRLDDFLDQMRAKYPQVIVSIIDACRDNPFQNGLGRTVGASRGLARIDPARGTFALFSAGTGQVALDALSAGDTNPNSVFTRSLLKFISKPGLSSDGCG